LLAVLISLKLKSYWYTPGYCWTVTQKSVIAFMRQNVIKKTENEVNIKIVVYISTRSLN